MDDDKIASCGLDEVLEESSDGTREKDKGKHEGKYASDMYRDHSDTEQGGLSSGWKEDVIFMPSESPTNTSQQFQEKYVKSIDEADAQLGLPDGFLDKLGKPVENACEIQEIEQYHSQIINIDSTGKDSTRIDNCCKIAGIEQPLNVTLQKNLNGSLTPKIAQLKVDESVHGRLYTACTEGDLKSVEAILDEHCDTLMPDERGQTPLYAACIGNQPQIIEYLVARGFAVDHQDNDGKTPLHIAYECGQPEIADLLLDKYKANWKLRDARRWTPLHSAVDQGHHGFCSRNLKEFLDEDIDKDVKWLQLFAACLERSCTAHKLLELDVNLERIDLLLKAINEGLSWESPPTLDIDFSLANKYGNTCLHAALVGQCSIEIVQSLVKRGSPLNHRNKNGSTPLLIACDKRNQEAIELLLSHDCDPNIPDEQGNAALHIAINNGCDHRIIQALIDGGANVDLLNDEQESPLIRACFAKNHETISVLLKAKADLSLADKNEDTALHLAIINETGIETEILKELILLCKQTQLDAMNNEGESALMLACMYGQGDTVALLLQAGASTTLCDKDGDTALHLAIINETGIEVLTKIIPHCKKAQLDAINNKGESALMLACWYDQDDTVALLLQAGASTTLRGKENRTCLYIAAGYGHSDTVRALLDHGAPVNAIANCIYTTALSAACVHASASVVQLLLERGANPNISDSDDRTPLRWCCNPDVKPKANERLAKAALLLKYGADPEKKDAEGRKPLDYAIEEENLAMFKVFFDHDPATLDMTLDSGETALHFCCKSGMTDMANWLLEHGVDKDRVCDAGTPLELALSHGHKNIVYLLLNAGANASLSAERTGFVETVYRQRRRFKDILHHIVSQKCNVDFTARDANHETLFFKACRDDDKDVVKMLLDSKHDIGINLCNNQCQSPVWVTCKNSEKIFCDALSILHFIVRGNREVDVDRPDHTQTTPLHLVCQENTPAMVNLIVNTSDKSVNVRDAKGRAPLQLATDPDVIKLLEKFGATKD